MKVAVPDPPLGSPGRRGPYVALALVEELAVGVDRVPGRRHLPTLLNACSCTTRSAIQRAVAHEAAPQTVGMSELSKAEAAGEAGHGGARIVTEQLAIGSSVRCLSSVRCPAHLLLQVRTRVLKDNLLA